MPACLPVTVSKITVSKTVTFDNSISGKDLTKGLDRMIKKVHYHFLIYSRLK